MVSSNHLWFNYPAGGQSLVGQQTEDHAAGDVSVIEVLFPSGLRRGLTASHTPCQ